MPENGRTSTERAPLLASQPTTVDGSNEIVPGKDVSQQAAQSMSTARGVLCIFALGCLIFLQGEFV